MSRQEKARRCERRGKGKFAYTEKNNPDLQNRQSPWANPTDFDPVADIIRRAIADAERIGAAWRDDCAWFDAHPDRSFHLRNAMPAEIDAGLAFSWVVMARSSDGPVRVPVPIPELAGCDASGHDIEEDVKRAFIRLTAHYTAANTDPFLFGIIEEIQRVR